MAKINLDKFPTSKTGQRMIKRVSPIYGQAYTAKWLYQVMGLEYDEVWRYFEELRAQAFVATTTWGIEAWEDRYSLEHPRDLTIEERRALIRRRKAVHLPLNPGLLEKDIKENFGQQVDIDESRHGYIYLIIDRLQYFKLEKIKEYLYNIKPSHLTVQFEHLWTTQAGAIYMGGVIQSARQITVETKSGATVNLKESRLSGGGIVGNRHKFINIK